MWIKKFPKYKYRYDEYFEMYYLVKRYLLFFYIYDGQTFSNKVAANYVVTVLNMGYTKGEGIY